MQGFDRSSDLGQIYKAILILFIALTQITFIAQENYGDYLNYLYVLEGMLQASVYNLRSLTGDYINLSRLEEDTKLARDHSFTHGPYEAFVRDQEPAPEIKELERSRKDDDEPDYEEERDNRSVSWPDLYDGLGH